FRMDADARHMAGIFQSDVLPGLAGVSRFPDAVAMRDVAADSLLAAANVNNIRVGLADGHGADRAAEEAVGDVVPGGAAVAGAPDAATSGPKVEQIRLARHAGDRSAAAAAKWPDQAVAEAGEVKVVGLVIAERGAGQQEGENKYHP